MTTPGFELTFQLQKVSRLPTEPPGRPAPCIALRAEYGSTLYACHNAACGQLNRENDFSPIPSRA